MKIYRYTLFKKSLLNEIFSRRFMKVIGRKCCSRSGSNINDIAHDWLHCKLKMPLYENNFEQSNEDCKAFKDITDKMSDTYKRKNHDYGNAFSEMYDELGINYGDGKIREKVNRIKTLKDNDSYGVLVSFKCVKDMSMKYCCHEASHACDAIEDAIGMKHGGESSAYLIGWIA